MLRKKQRKIIRTQKFTCLFLNRYQALKLDKEGWNEHGREYSIKGIDNLIKGNGFEFEYGTEIEQDLKQYREQRQKKQEKWKQRQKQSIEQKLAL
jgi:uncharacterized protein YacL (UPF0231 family)